MTEAPPPSRGTMWARLVLLSAAALCVFWVVDHGLYQLSHERWPALAVAADLRLTSLALMVAAYVFSPRTRSEMPLWTRGPDALTLRLIVGWLVGTFLFVHFTHNGKVALPRTFDSIAFGMVGPINEELAIRALVLTAALALWPTGRKAIAWSTLVFSAMHLQYHAFHFREALPQLLWTLPVGALLAFVALRTRSLALVMLVHIANNAVVVLA